MVAFQDETIYDVATKVGDYNKTGGVPRPQPQAVTEHNDEIGSTDVHRKYVKVKISTLMYGQFLLATEVACI